MLTRSRRAARVSLTALALAVAFWIVPGPSAFAKGGGGGHGGGGHGGGGHGGGGHGGHGGGHHSGGHHSGGYHHGGYHHGGYYSGGHHYGYYNGYFPGYFGGYGYGYYPGYGYGYYGTGSSYPYYNSGYSYPTYGYAPAYVVQGPAVADASLVPSQGRYLGIDETPVVDGGVRGMQVMRVYPGSAAERTGLQAGDVIHSANGYAIQEHGNLTWVISNLPPDGVLQMNVRSARDEVEHVISASIP